ncbi:MAG: GNAT family N-acetyltransferase [Hoeflea sp.]|uniref:GNAT family N-acetyltransferase n=1 Tax=Hoeflea sp. TaxID=1940281 RepID=UPI0032F02153
MKPLNSIDRPATCPDRIGFRPVTAKDYDLLEDWMGRPHWQEWWGDVETELGYVRDMVEGRDRTRPFLFLLDGRPAGYIQSWQVSDNLVEPWISKAPWLIDVPADAIGVDLSVGVEADLGKGLGTAALKAFLRKLTDEGHCNIIIDPDAANARAIRAYEKAGFVPLLVAPDPDSDQETLIMHLQTDGPPKQPGPQQ